MTHFQINKWFIHNDIQNYNPLKKVQVQNKSVTILAYVYSTNTVQIKSSFTKEVENKFIQILYPWNIQVLSQELVLIGCNN